MKQIEIFDPQHFTRLQNFTKEELIQFLELQLDVNNKMASEIRRLKALEAELKQRSLLVEDQYITLKNKFFGRSSEKEKSQKEEKPKSDKTAKKRVQLPSLRYPNAPIIERHITLDNPPKCACCSHQLTDSGMTEDSEYLTVVPAQYIVIKEKKHKYRCEKCHGNIKTAPANPRIKPGSVFSDEMIIDVALSKFCDLIPIERYASIAGREGLKDLPPQSLIESTHYLADFLKVVYDQIKAEIILSRVLHADETPHRMLEGDDKSRWYLWGFSTLKSSYFEIHDTRSGSVASNLLTDSQCEFLISDVFSGYHKAIGVSNEKRKEQNRPLIKNPNCNAHARRKFKEAMETFVDEAKYFVDEYKEIYKLEKLAKENAPEEILKVRSQMETHFTNMKSRAMANLKGYSSKSSIGKAMSYYLGNYEGLTIFIKNSEVAIDNNQQERLLRNPVIGRKTWYGTHSIRGAETAAVLFTIVETCKLNEVNPREYFKNLVEDLHQGKKPYTPSEYKNLAN